MAIRKTKKSSSSSRSSSKSSTRTSSKKSSSKSSTKTRKKKGSRSYDPSKTISVVMSSIEKKSLQKKKKKTKNIITEINKQFKNKKFDLIKYMKIIQKVKKHYLDKCTLEELEMIKNDLKMNINNKKFEIINKFIDSAVRFNFVDKIVFKPVYNPKHKNNTNQLPCLKDEYKFIKELGEGAYGIVNLVEKHGKKYAIKKIEIRYSSYNPVNKQITTIKNEIKILKRIGNLGISPKLHDYYLCKDKKGFAVYLIMDYIEGKTLNDYLKKNNLSKKLKKNIEDVFKKLNKHGIIHGDEHGGNVMITKNKRVFIIDFGFSETINEFLKKKYNNLFNDYSIKNIKIDILSSILIKMKVI